MIDCELLTVVCTDEDGVVAELVVPAYTRSEDSFISVVSDLQAVYLRRSNATANFASVADFALYLLTAASQEPHQMD